MHILVFLSSQIFIANVLSLLLAYTVIYSLTDTESIHGFRYYIVQYQICFVSSTMLLSFLIFAYAATAGYQHQISPVATYIGLGLTAVLVFGLFFVAGSTLIANRMARKQQEKEEGPPATHFFNHLNARVLDMPTYQTVLIALLVLLETGITIALLVVGTMQARNTPTHIHCDTVVPAGWGNGFVPVSIIGNVGLSASETVTVIDGMGMTMETARAESSTTTMLTSEPDLTAMSSSMTDGVVETVIVSFTSTVYAAGPAHPSSVKHI